MSKAVTHKLELTDGVTNADEFEALDQNNQPVDISDLKAELTIRSKKGGNVLLSSRTDDATPMIAISGTKVVFTANFQTDMTRYKWDSNTWFWIDLLDPETDPEERRAFVQGSVTVDIGSQVTGVP